MCRGDCRPFDEPCSCKAAPGKDANWNPRRAILRWSACELTWSACIQKAQLDSRADPSCIVQIPLHDQGTHSLSHQVDWLLMAQCSVSRNWPQSKEVPLPKVNSLPQGQPQPLVTVSCGSTTPQPPCLYLGSLWRVSPTSGSLRGASWALCCSSLALHLLLLPSPAAPIPSQDVVPKGNSSVKETPSPRYPSQAVSGETVPQKGISDEQVPDVIRNHYERELTV